MSKSSTLKFQDVACFDSVTHAIWEQKRNTGDLMPENHEAELRDIAARLNISDLLKLVTVARQMAHSRPSSELGAKAHRDLH